MAKKSTTLKSTETVPLTYKGFSLSPAQKAALLAQAGTDTNLKYGGQVDGLNSRTQLEAGQSGLIDEAYKRYKQKLSDGDAVRRAALGVAGQSTQAVTNAANQSMAGVFGGQDAGNAAMNEITGESPGNNGESFRRAIVQALGQQGTDTQGARTSLNNVNEGYSGALAGQAGLDQEFYKQKSTDRLAGLSAEQRALALTMGAGKVSREDELKNILFEQWAANEKIKLGNREVNVNDKNKGLDRKSAEKIASEKAANATPPADPKALTPSEQRKFDGKSSSLQDYVNAANKLTHNSKYSLPGGKKDWALIRHDMQLTGKGNDTVWGLVHDLAYPNHPELSPAGKGLAKAYFGYDQLPSWIKGRK